MKTQETILAEIESDLIPISPPILQLEGRFGFDERGSHDFHGNIRRKHLHLLHPEGGGHKLVQCIVKK